MATKKKKQKQIRQVSPAELINQAKEQLQRGEIDRAVQHLRGAETALKPRQTAEGKKVSVPPHIIAAQAELPALLARALAARALIAVDPKQRLGDLTEAAKYAPEDARYRVALGAGRLLAGDTRAAFADFEQAEELQPGNALATRAFALGLLAAGRAREAVESLNALPAEQRGKAWQRLAAVSAVSNGKAAPASAPLNQLIGGLQALASGDAERASAQLAEISMPAHNPTRAEAAQLATQFFYHGALSFNAGRYDPAVADWRQAERLLRTHGLRLSWCDRLAAYYHKVAENVWQQNLPLAIECWREAASLLPKDQTAPANLAAAKQAQAQQAWRDGQVEQALKLWQELAETRPGDEGLLRKLAVASERLGRKLDAVTHWRNLARAWRQQARQRDAEPGFKDRLLQLERHVVNLMFEADVDRQAIVTELESALKLDPDNPELRQQTAESLLGIGRVNQALRHLEAVEKQHGASAELLMRKGMAYNLMRRRNDAHQAFERAIELDPENPAARRAYLILLGKEATQAEENDNVKQAIAVCEKQLKLDPNYEPAMTQLAGLYFDDYRDQEAKQLLERLVALNPRKSQSLIRAARVYLECGMEKEAAALFQQAIEVEPSALCFYNIGICYWNEGEQKTAINYYDRAAQAAKPDDVDLLVEIASNLAGARKRKDSDRFFKRAMAIDPANPLPHMARAISLLGISALIIPSTKDINEAIRELKEAERLADGNPEYASMVETASAIRRALESRPLGLQGAAAFFDEADEDDEDDSLSIEEIARLLSAPKRKKRK